MAEKRYVGDYPVIGIRPVIDGRRGPMKLRESLEDQTMAMAQTAKKLFEENLYYSNGDPVKVVIADTSIGRVPEAAACADKFKKEGVNMNRRTSRMDAESVRSITSLSTPKPRPPVGGRPYSRAVI